MCVLLHQPSKTALNSPLFALRAGFLVDRCRWAWFSIFQVLKNSTTETVFRDQNSTSKPCSSRSVDICFLGWTQISNLVVDTQCHPSIKKLFKALPDTIRRKCKNFVMDLVCYLPCLGSWRHTPVVGYLHLLIGVSALLGDCGHCWTRRGASDGGVSYHTCGTAVSCIFWVGRKSNSEFKLHMISPDSLNFLSFCFSWQSTGNEGTGLVRT